MNDENELEIDGVSEEQNEERPLTLDEIRDVMTHVEGALTSPKSRLAIMRESKKKTADGVAAHFGVLRAQEAQRENLKKATEKRRRTPSPKETTHTLTHKNQITHTEVPDGG